MWKKNNSSEQLKNSSNKKITTQVSDINNESGCDNSENTNDFSIKNSSAASMISKSSFFNGEINGNEDLIVDGKMTGKITLKNNTLKVNSSGFIEADIQAKYIDIEGTVVGHIICSEKIIVRTNGEVVGDIVASRVILEDGCIFKGKVDMLVPAQEEPNKNKDSNNQMDESDREKLISSKQNIAEFIKGSHK